MLSTIKDIFNNNLNILDKKEWIEITNCLIKQINIEKYSILKYKQDFDNSLIIENVINHKASHSHSVIYINPKYKLKKIKDTQKVYIDFLYPHCIINLWKSNLISTSDFEDKLFYITSFIIDNINELNKENIKNWINLLYYMKKKSVNDVLQKLIWEVYYKIFNIVEPIFVDVDVLYFNKDDWKTHKNNIMDKLTILSDKIEITKWNIIPIDERNIVEFPFFENKKKEDV
jgi:hypothetical protein